MRTDRVMLEKIRTILRLATPRSPARLPPPIDTPALRAWFDGVGAADVDIDWSAEWLTLYGTDSLLRRQSGYADPPGASGAAWPASWLVIGDIHGNPIVFDRNAASDAILFGRHGQGTWTMRPLANDLSALNAALTAWCDLYHIRFGGNILDGDYELLDAFKADLTAALQGILRPPELDTFLFAAAG